jgi:hypothetical protein
MVTEKKVDLKKRNEMLMPNFAPAKQQNLVNKKVHRYGLTMKHRAYLPLLISFFYWICCSNILQCCSHGYIPEAMISLPSPIQTAGTHNLKKI